jgi:GTP diphosphokinase / guanosine-3',5'-bis(diphosphate) 3'-diphosphatase
MLVRSLLERHMAYYPNSEPEKIEKAWELAQITYNDQKRQNGDTWLNHARAVAELTVDLKMDSTAVCAALLHDAPRFDLTGDEISDYVGEDVRILIDNVYDIKRLSDRYNKTDLTTTYSDYLRRIILVTGKDLRAVVVRLVEKLDDLDSIEVLDANIRDVAISRAINVYAPLADSIGTYELRWRFEDKAFKLSDPESYKLATQLLGTHPFSKKGALEGFSSNLKNILDKHPVKVHDVFGRTKRPYSLYKKLSRYAKRLNADLMDIAHRVNDKIAFTILTDSEEACYAVLDIIHKNFRYEEKRYDDYIVNPKPNGYKSLQTVIEAAAGHFVEIQIKTKEMHEYNEYGPASHIYYKMNGDGKLGVGEEKVKILQRLLLWRERFTEDASHANVENIEKTILAFTPKGDVIELPSGSTPIDFAYELHTELGNKAMRALVNKKQVSLNHQLKNGDVVEIVKDKSRIRPSTDWLEFVKSKTAIAAIKKYGIRQVPFK